MADKKENAPPKDKKAKAPGKKGAGRVKLFVIMLVVIGIAMPAIGIIVLAGIIPSLVMGFTDRSVNKSLTVCVFAPNLAGCLQVVIQLLQSGGGVFDIPNAMNLVSRPDTFLIMWGAAGVGFGLFSFIPPLIAGALAGMAEVKIKKLRSNQKELKRIWGDQVSGGLN